MGLGRGVQLKISPNSMGELKCKVCADVANVIVMKCEGFFFFLFFFLMPESYTMYYYHRNLVFRKIFKVL